MLCDICKKNEATIHIKEMHNNKWTSLNLCAECAKKNDLEAHAGMAEADITKMLIGLGKALEEQGKSIQKKSHQDNQQREQNLPDIANCPICDWSVSDIRDNHGKFGCPVCYSHFKDLTDQTFAKIQKGPAHTGKRPANAPDTDAAAYEYTLAVLKKTMAKYIAEEDYESAAKLRDGIARMKQKYAETGSIK